MTESQIMRCNNCDRPHQVNILDPKSTREFSFQCRCLSKITGSYKAGSWEVVNATVAKRDPTEAVFLHEPLAT